MEKKILCIVNPNASKGHGNRYEQKIEESFALYSIEVEFAHTEYRDHAIELTMKGIEQGFDTIVACGGDGTVNEVVNGIMRSGRRAKLGIIPLGRGNDFAWSARIPKRLEKAVELIARGESRFCDIGLLKGGAFPEGRYFANGAGLGFEALINSRASSFRHINGMPSYFLALLENLIVLPKPYELSLDIDGREVNVTSQQLSLSGGRRMGSAFILGPRAELCDGFLDLSYANRRVRHLELLGLIFAFLRGRQLELELMEYTRCRKVTIRSNNIGMAVQADGEEIGDAVECLSVEIIPAAIELFYTTIV